MSHASPQFKQLPMFATPAELGEMASGDLGGTPVKNWYSEIAMRRITGDHEDDRHDGWGPGGYVDDMRKAVESSHGISKPVHAWIDHSGSPWLLDGHHRAQIAMDSNRLVPVMWHHNWDRGEAEHDVFRGPDRDEGLDGV